MMAVFAEELSSWGGPFCVSQRQDRCSSDFTTPSGPALVLPSIRPAIQTPSPMLVAPQVASLQPLCQPAPGIPVHYPLYSDFSQLALYGKPSSER